LSPPPFPVTAWKHREIFKPLLFVIPAGLLAIDSWTAMRHAMLPEPLWRAPGAGMSEDLV
jgi:hypothetical protein